MQAQDWQANDLRNYDVVNGTTVFGDRNKPSYNGVNVYGDQIGSTPPIVNIGPLARGGAFQAVYAQAYQAAINQGASPAVADQIARQRATEASNFIFATRSDSVVSRTGYAERDVVDYNTYNIKFNGGLYYKIRPSLELSLVGYWGAATTVYTGADRYSLKNAQIGQYKLELKAITSL